MKTYKKPLFLVSEIEENQLLCLENNGPDDSAQDGENDFSELKNLGL